MADRFEARAAQLAPMAVIENGTPVNFAGYVTAIAPADWFRYYAGWIDKLSGQVPPMLDGAGLHYTVRAPYGVIAILTAFNAPMSFIGMKVAPALAAGNCVVIKPSELAPWSALAFAQLCSEAGLPRGTSAHGLRKAACRRLAEAGCSANVIAAISGHVSLREVQRYTAAADQARMARSAIDAVTSAFSKERTSGGKPG